MIINKIYFPDVRLSPPSDDEDSEQQGKMIQDFTLYFSVIEDIQKAKETYGGCYPDDYGTLNILVAAADASETDLKTVKDYKNIVAPHKREGEAVIYHIVPYPLDYLRSLQYDLTREDLNLIMTSVDEPRNLLVLGYEDEEKFDPTKVIDFIGSDEFVLFVETHVDLLVYHFDESNVKGE